MEPKSRLAAWAPWELRHVLRAVEAAVAGGADTCELPDPWPNDVPDPVWTHAAATDARDITLFYGISWEFAGWSAFAALLRAAIDEQEQPRS